MKKSYFYVIGALTGIANGLFGAGGGAIAVPLLEKSGMKPQNSHATSIAITLQLSIISAILYYKEGHFQFSEAIKFIPGGVAGAVLGGYFLKKIPANILKKVFGVFMIILGARMLLR